MEISGGGMRHGILTLAIATVDELFACYMPFVKGGGLFVPTRKPFVMGDEVFLLLDLYDDPEKIPLAGKVVWITPTGVVTSRKQGIGVQLNADAEALVNRIDTLLAGYPAPDAVAHTV